MKDHKLQLIVASALCVVAASLLIAGFWVSPRGEIHHSNLIAFGEIMSFVGAIFGIHYTYHFKSQNLDK